MPKLSPKDLASLYPQPKTFDELDEERKRRDAARQPRHFALKISLWTTLGVAIILVAYELVWRIMAGSLDSEGAVIFGLTTSILLACVAGVAVYYLYSLIAGLTAKMLIFTSRLYAAVAGIIFVAAGLLAALAQFGYGNVVTTAIALLLVFLATCFAVDFVVKHDSK